MSARRVSVGESTTNAATARRPWRPATYLCATAAGYALLYGLANHWTSLRHDVGRGVYAWETAIPFIGWTIVPYLSVCVFFALSFFVDTGLRELQRHVARLALVLVASVICYALVPLQFTFVRPATHGVIGLLFDALAGVDLPYNRAPSLHIGVLAILWVRVVPALKGWSRVALQAWFMLIAVSVLTTYQHHVLDVPAGAALGALVIALTARERARWCERAATVARTWWLVPRSGRADGCASVRGREPSSMSVAWPARRSTGWAASATDRREAA